jgi:LemA protein
VEVAMGMVVVAAVVFVVFAWAALTYNGLVKLRNMLKEGWSGIEVQLKRRSTLIPSLVETVKGYMGHERGLLSEIAELRSKSLQAQKIGEKGEIETALSRSLGSLLAVAEAYPDLKANQNFLELQKELTEIEDQIQMARRYYNGTARNLNIAIESFPSLIVARLFGFTQAEFFAVDDASDRQAPPVVFGGQK